ncbi:MAG TPA: DUF5752 family protein [Alphaproteobacteria bacterium]|nr:DUF5752 family protein [Alphaproteobacteria bacterium]
MKKESVKKNSKSPSAAKNSKKAVAVVKESLPALVNNASNQAKPSAPAPAQAAKPSGKSGAKPAVKTIIKKHTLYVEVTPDKYFVLCDGRKLKNAKELADTLQLINDDMFKYHVTDTKNDFANWINDVFGEPELAKKIKSVRSRFDMSIELYREMFDRLNKSKK